MAVGRGRKLAKRGLRSIGFEVKRFDPTSSFQKRRQLLIESLAVDTLLDIGAHAGEYGESLRHSGFDGRIISFEPQGDLFKRLEQATSPDPRWDCLNQAVGSSPGTVTLNVSGNDGFSSSILSMAQAHEEADPTSSFVSAETVYVTTLDEAMTNSVEHNDSTRMMVKADTQGYESEVIAGAMQTLQHCFIVELELALVELYDGQPLFPDLLAQMADRDFVLTDVDSGFRDPHTSQLLQIDGLFIRK